MRTRPLESRWVSCAPPGAGSELRFLRVIIAMAEGGG
jgi:hypothetical protein